MHFVSLSLTTWSLNMCYQKRWSYLRVDVAAFSIILINGYTLLTLHILFSYLAAVISQCFVTLRLCTNKKSVLYSKLTPLYTLSAQEITNVTSIKKITLRVFCKSWPTPYTWTKSLSCGFLVVVIWTHIFLFAKRSNYTSAASGVPQTAAQQEVFVICTKIDEELFCSW